jgi:hypothetical protein
MGGALLKKWGLPEKRLSNDEYNRLKNTLLDTLSGSVHRYHTDKEFGDYYDCADKFGVAPAIRQKETHGDLDILVGVDDLEKDLSFNRRTYQDMLWEWQGDRLNTLEFLERLSGYMPSVNSNVISFPYKGFQVDLTFVPLEDFYSSKNYNSWGDCSNLLGRVFHKMGLHFGHTGLSFWIRQGMFDNNVTWSDNDHIYEKVVLTKNMEDICKIGGFDYSKWIAGFDTNEEVYRFVTESEYFRKELFAFENLNHINRVRNKKRPMYAAFVEWLETTDPDESGKKEFLDKSTYALIYQKKFSHLQTAISKYYFEYNVTKCLKSKLNGRIIMDVLGIEDGKTVGQIMSAIKKEFTTMELIGKTESEIRVIIGDAAAYLAHQNHLMLQ